MPRKHKYSTTHLPTRKLVIDSFAGGGGASTGITMALGFGPDIAINHDPEAIALHQANHPGTIHYCESVWDVSPKKVTGGQPVGLAWFSPDCKHFSRAKGGKPVDNKVRGLAWVVVRWAKDVRPDVIILENVKEFKDWGPLLEDGKPCPLQRGFTFRRWLGDLKKAGYEVEVRNLAARDYGSPTTRERLFVIARCDGQPIVWPKATHGTGTANPYLTSADCVDFSIPCPSIFGRKKPLAENTLRRIARGIQRYVIDAANPFIIPLTHHGDRRVHPLDEPMPTVTGAHRGELAVVVPYIARIGQTGGQGKYVNDIREPLTTLVTKNEHMLIVPTLIQTGYGEREGQAPRISDIQKPMSTVVAGGVKQALVAAFLIKHYGDNGQQPGSRLADPISTITAVDHHGFVACHLQRDFGNSVGTSLDEPAATTTAGGGGHQALVASHLMKLRGGFKDHKVTAQDMRLPAPTITASGTHLADVQAFLEKYSGSDEARGLVTINGERYIITDIGMRMLEPRELYRAQGFPDSYIINIMYKGKPLTKTAQVRMCGNSVCPQVGAALVWANVGMTMATQEIRARMMAATASN